jgi:hypothetical protein
LNEPVLGSGTKGKSEAVSVDTVPIVNDEESPPVEDDSLHVWWSGLSDPQRVEAYRIGPQTPMPTWMTASLVAAGIPGLVDAPDRPEGLKRRWCYMPAEVAKLIARRRRGDES